MDRWSVVEERRDFMAGVRVWIFFSRDVAFIAGLGLGRSGGGEMTPCGVCDEKDVNDGYIYDNYPGG